MIILKDGHMIRNARGLSLWLESGAVVQKLTL